MRKDRMFNRECKWIASEEPSLVAVDSLAESRTRTKYRRFSKVSTRFSFALQELKQDVQKVVPRHRFISGQAFWTELQLFDERDAPSSDALCAAIEFDQDEDLDSGCGDELEDFDDSVTEKSRKFGWREHVELYLERAGQISEYDDATTNVGETMSESFTQRAPGDANESEVTASMLDFSLTSTLELDSVADDVHKLIEQISDEMFSPPAMEEPAKDIAAVPAAVAGSVPSDAGYSTVAGQGEPGEMVGLVTQQPSTQLPVSSSVASGKKATRRRTSKAAPAAPSAAIATAIVATPLHARPIPRIRSVLKKRSAYATEPPSTVKKSVTFSTTVAMSPYEERDTRKLADDSNILENTLPRQQSTPKVSHQQARGAKRKCVYDFHDDLEEETETEELAKSVEVSTQTEKTESTAEMIRTIVEYTINSFKEVEETKSEGDSSTERAIQEILEHTKASFKVDETPKKKKRKRRKFDLLNDSIIQLHKKVDRLEKRERRRQRRPRPTCRLVVKKVVPAKAKPCTERCTQTDAPVMAEASVATTFELSKPPPKKRAPQKKAAKVKQPDDPEGGTPKPKRARRKDQQTIEECLNGEGGSTAADVIREPKKITARKVVPDVVRMDDGQLVAQDSEDNLSREFEIEESLPPLSPPPSRTLVDPRLIKGAHRKPPSIIDTNQDSPALSSMPQSPASQCSFPNNRAASDEESESFTRNLIRLRIGPVPGHSSSSSLHAVKQKPRRLQPYPKSPKLRPPPTVPVARQYSFQTLYLGPEPPSAPTTLWKDPLIYPVDACKYIEQRLQPVLCEARLPTLQATYGNPCWFVSLKAALKLLLDFTGEVGETQGTANMAVPCYPQFSQEFSPIAGPEGANHFVDDEDDGERGHDSGSDVPDD
ncbi:hypothetical protein pipiens_001537 [Culex pipiens pipiens]|uniref:Uncharacterized protein n=1 Tax=Culex pipiens pipiens TaxID=38569 RepID=A0ABD1CMC9_CULPP